jgi:hypothetical protein
MTNMATLFLKLAIALDQTTLNRLTHCPPGCSQNCLVPSGNPRQFPRREATPAMALR